MSRSTILVDGYNLLIGLARREGVTDLHENLPVFRHRLLQLLSDLAEHGDATIVVVWDGHGASPAGLSGKLRNVFVEPPAEADDFIVKHAEERAARGLTTSVVTRDKGLLRRLPDGCEAVAMDSMTEDLLALASGPVSARHVTGPAAAEDESWIPATRGDVDLTRLPRRRATKEDPELAPGASAAPPQRTPPRTKARTVSAPPAPPVGDARARAAARDRKSEKRKRWERAQKRRSEKSAKKR